MLVVTITIVTTTTIITIVVTTISIIVTNDAIHHIAVINIATINVDTTTHIRLQVESAWAIPLLSATFQNPLETCTVVASQDTAAGHAAKDCWCAPEGLKRRFCMLTACALRRTFLSAAAQRFAPCELETCVVEYRWAVARMDWPRPFSLLLERG